jgi:diguanylate cyclase (GGDEF)-like protein
MKENNRGVTAPTRKLADVRRDIEQIQATDGQDPRFANLVASHLQDSLILADAIRGQEVEVFEGANMIALKQAKAEKNGMIDPMTGLYLKTAFELQFESTLARSRRERKPTAIAYLDLDDFSMVNNEESHEHGHTVLKVVGRILREDIRTSDLSGRVGGEEIVIVLPNATEEQAKQRLSEIGSELPDRVSEGLIEHGITLEKRITASIGIAAITFDDPLSDSPTSVDMRRILDSGDQRMRMAKIMGKNRVVGSEEEAHFRTDPQLMEVGRTGKYRIH